MTTQTVECPHCGSEYFNYTQWRTVERVALRAVAGKLKMDKPLSGRGVAKTPKVTAVCRNCGGGYDEHELMEAADSC